jgi:excisionase family DNA binding protein
MVRRHARLPRIGDLPLVLTVEEFAAAMRISRNAAYAAIAANAVPGVIRIGRTIRIPRSALAVWLSGGEGDSREEASSNGP